MYSRHCTYPKTFFILYFYAKIITIVILNTLFLFHKIYLYMYIFVYILYVNIK
ncbi:hypothetical protein CLU79DRAFT_763635 [Phycomyces nitens]|nr:hypothetical protein CLU79DRAFT_763635 [Phycomyces nitens]